MPTMTQSWTEAEIKEIAVGLHAGTILCDRQFTEDQLKMSWPIMFLMDEETLTDLYSVIAPNGDEGPYGAFFEYVSKASPVAANGWPIFFSVRFIDPDNWARVVEVVNQLEAL